MWERCAPWFSRHPSIVRFKLPIVNEWPERSSSRRSPPFLSLTVLFFSSALPSKRHSSQQHIMMWLNVFSHRVLQNALLPHKSSLPEFVVCNPTMCTCAGMPQLFQGVCLLYMEEVVQGFFCLRLVFALSKSSVRGTLEDAATCWACVLSGRCSCAGCFLHRSRFILVAAFCWVDAFLSFV